MSYDVSLSFRAGAITFLVNHDLSDFFIDLSTEVNRAIALLLYPTKLGTRLVGGNQEE